MTTVTIPALVVVGLAGDTGGVVLSYDLVSAGLRPLVGLRSVDGALVTCHGSKAISDTDTENPVVSWDLTPQSQILTPDGNPCYYRIACHTDSVAIPQTVWIIQVPDLSDPIDLRDLVGASTISPPVAGVPSGGEESQILAKKSDTDYDTHWIDAPTGGIGSTNLSVSNKTAISLDIASDTGTDATLPAATADDAGLMTAAQYTKLAGIDAAATAAGTTGDAFATSHLSAFDHANIANGQTAYGWGNHASAGYLTSVTYGTTAGTACQGNDARLSDARTPVVTTLTDIGADLADADEFPVYDTSATETKKSALTRIWTYIAAKLASFTGDLTAKSISLNQNISQAAWTTSGVRVKNTAVTLTDTSSSGTVAAAYTNVWGGNTIAASNTTTFTDYATHYFNAPVAGSNVTITNAWAAIFNGNARVSGDLSGPKLTEYTEKLYAVTTSGNVTISLMNGPFQRFVLDAARQFTMPSSPGAVACSFNMMLSCAGYTPTWNSTPTITWMTDDGTAPTLNTTTGKLNRLYFEWDNTTSAWLGYLLRAQA